MTTVLSSYLLAQQGAPPDDIFDIVVLEPKESPWGFLFWLGLAFLLVLASIAALWFWFRQRAAKEKLHTPEAKIASAFRQLAAMRGEMEPNEFSLAISEALKDYLSARFKDPVRFETTQEFLARASSAKSPLPPPACESLKEFLVSAEEVKFGNTPDAGERAEPLLSLAGAVVTHCRPALSEETKKKESPW